jgi:hypothetical protein
MNISQGWICDTCGLPIKESSDGSIEWIECSNGRYKGKGLRLIHNISASPRKNIPPNSCNAYTEKHHQGLNDLPLSEFLGSNGLMLLLSKLTNSELPIDEVVEMIKRPPIQG